MSSENVIQKPLGRSIHTKEKELILECPEVGLKKRLGRRAKEELASPSFHLPPTPPRPYACLKKECDWTQINVRIDKSLALILPDGLKYAMEIEDAIIKKGFTIIQKIQVRLSPEQASELMENLYGHLIYLPMVCYLTSASLIALCVAKKNAVEELKKLCGPENIRMAMRDFPYSIRAIFGDPKAEDPIKVIHCSQSSIDAEREIHFFFPGLILEPYPRGFEVNDYLHERLLSTLRNGLAQLLQEKPIEPVLWLADWLLCNNPYKPRVKREIALTET